MASKETDVVVRRAKGDSKLWQGAYNAKNTSRIKKPSQKKILRLIHIQDKWLETHKEMLRWRKTAEFAKWRHKQFLKQGGSCYYCDEPLIGTRENVEHIIPKIRGGDNRKSNLVLACYKCNKDKYTKILPRKERQKLKDKNRKKKGTYLRNFGHLKSEEQFGYELGQMFKE